MTLAPRITHHGAIDGVTGSCHQLSLPDDPSPRIDCGLFQGAETSSDSAGSARLTIFPIDRIRTLIVTHVPINHAHTWHMAHGTTKTSVSLAPFANIS
ncbi:hypothetical protein ACCAA_1460004 [Candidatus Accumulibacter aalborgensis]|uniref:Metallo-beta-lactamase domain-containing protein n=1 Tax=Candidatus Accumulibacter aalborgensis TaxID=1860102 RepID=A0A1A8XJB9_9PROT|nr:RNA procession exonuclease [Candidatus Accumulibacter aalborgensis]SBT04482.1 hypothetical protein ACCAA_1460004 [Candidatus Accumulibacter aalborgensis]